MDTLNVITSAAREYDLDTAGIIVIALKVLIDLAVSLFRRKK